MEWTNGSQLYDLLLSCGLGFLLGAYYDVFRVFRLALKSGKRALFLQDVFFFASAAVVTFLFALAVTDGQLRFYLFGGEGAGFAAYYFTIGRLVMRFAGAVIRAVLRGWHLLWTAVCFPFRMLWRPLRPFMKKTETAVQKILRKPAGFLKKGLKQARGVLYNQLNRRRSAQAEDERTG